MPPGIHKRVSTSWNEANDPLSIRDVCKRLQALIFPFIVVSLSLNESSASIIWQEISKHVCRWLWTMRLPEMLFSSRENGAEIVQDPRFPPSPCYRGHHLSQRQLWRIRRFRILWWHREWNSGARLQGKRYRDWSIDYKFRHKHFTLFHCDFYSLHCTLYHFKWSPRCDQYFLRAFNFFAIGLISIFTFIPRIRTRMSRNAFAK